MLRRLSTVFIALAFTISTLGAANIPRPAGDLKIKTPVGQVSLAQYKGKIVVLEFLLTTCPNCKRCSAVMEKLNKEFAAQGVQMLGVAINEGADQLVRQYASELNLSYPIGTTDYRLVPDFLQHPKEVRMMMPQLVFIDRTGTVRGQYAGTDQFFLNEEQNIRDNIQRLLKPAAAKKAPAGKK